jgi:hypothetical protein
MKCEAVGANFIHPRQWPQEELKSMHRVERRQSSGISVHIRLCVGRDQNRTDYRYPSGSAGAGKYKRFFILPWASIRFSSADNPYFAKKRYLPSALQPSISSLESILTRNVGVPPPIGYNQSLLSEELPHISARCDWRPTFCHRVDIRTPRVPSGVIGMGFPPSLSCTKRDQVTRFCIDKDEAPRGHGLAAIRWIR